MKTCIIIAGPTAIGKTARAIEVARHFGTEIISADSRQCYRELNIGVAKPTKEELAAIPHHFIGQLSIKENFSVAGYEKFALQQAEDLFNIHDFIILTGGTGLYLKAFTDGLNDIPVVDENIRTEIRKKVEQEGIAWAVEKLNTGDPDFSNTQSIQNPQRVMRALEVLESTGKPIGSFQSKVPAHRPFNIVKLCLQMPSELLYERINKRVDEMVEDGLEEEVKGLIPFKNFNALNTVGYKEFFDYFEGKNSFQETIESIKRNTRRYAKRQNTWFRNSGGYLFVEPQQEAIMAAIHDRLKSLA